MLGDRRLRDREVPCEFPTTAFPLVGNGLQNPKPCGIREGFRNFDDVLQRQHGRRPLRLSLYSHLPKYTHSCLQCQGLWSAQARSFTVLAGRRGHRDTSSRERSYWRRGLLPRYVPCVPSPAQAIVWTSCPGSTRHVMLLLENPHYEYYLLTFRANFRGKMRSELRSWDEHNNHRNPRTSRRHPSYHRTPQEHACGRIIGYPLPAQWQLAGLESWEYDGRLVGLYPLRGRPPALSCRAMGQSTPTHPQSVSRQRGKTTESDR